MADETIELFISRAQAVSARVCRVADEAAAAKAVADEKARLGVDRVGVARAVFGIAATGTCVVATDDEETRLATMLPETSVLLLRSADVVPDVSDMAGYLRGRQEDGRISYTSFITGPSRTADIERVGAIGVHGPLDVLILLIDG